MITDKKRMMYLGQGWQAQQQVDIMKNISLNEGAAGGMAAAGAGLGMGFGVAGMMGGMMQQGMGNNPMGGGNPMQPQQQAPAANPMMEKLKQLKDMLDMGLITQEDFEQQKQKILSQM
jgi:membrane protease subunit (stomatin/prohibitin family)